MLRFEEFFEKATRTPPYPYQKRFAELDVWPDALEVPTGAGKTAAVVLGWLWRRRHASDQIRRSTGRRLVLCLPMRTLTTQTETSVRAWLGLLQLVDAPTVHLVMGGSVDDDWVGRPDAEAIIIGTQDLLLSRALNRGFAMSSRFAWPMAFGLLHNDVQWVFDEVQLMGVGASTSAQLAAFRASAGTFGPQHALWMSATLDTTRLATVDRGDSCTVLRLAESESNEGQLAVLLDAPKRVHALDADPLDPKAVAAAVVKVHQPGTRTLVVVNQVRRAQDLHAALARQKGSPELALLHSRFRPGDRAEIETRVLAREWTGILVATQTVEAGVDISARTLVTELAPWASFVQRAGRCNRWGKDATADVYWLDLPDEEAPMRPYEPVDLAVSRERLRKLKQASPRELSRHPSDSSGVLMPVLRRRDLLDLFDTTPDLSGADVDVSPFIRDGDETDIYVAWRHLPTEGVPGEDEPLPGRAERCAVPIGAARALLEQLRKRDLRPWRWNPREEAWVTVDRVVPGNVWLVPSEAGGYSVASGFTGKEDGPVAPLPDACIAPEGEGSEPRSRGTPEILSAHLDRVVSAVTDLVAASGPLPIEVAHDLLLAARWHDAGKAHPVFQRTMHRGRTDDPSVLAKSNGRGRHERRGFRHEVASTLALLDAEPSAFRAAYLVAAHHGRARLVVRARPGESPPPDGRRFALGVWEGDSLPAVELGGGVRMREQSLSLALFEVGGGGMGLGWTARAIALRDDLGVFRLAWLETLLRAADWRASATPAEAH